MKHRKANLMALVAIAWAVTQSAAAIDIGSTATDFRLKSVDGTMVSLSDFEDARGFIVIFTCNTCPYAKAYESRIIKLHEKYAPLGYPVIAINPNDPAVQPGDSYQAMQERADEKDFPFPYLIDESQEVARAYGATRTPHVYLLSADRKVMYIGAIDDNYKSDDPGNTKYVEQAIEAMRSGKNIEKEVTKAIGCTIKWKES